MVGPSSSLNTSLKLAADDKKAQTSKVFKNLDDNEDGFEAYLKPSSASRADERE